jgi:heme exporter protein C
MTVRLYRYASPGEADRLAARLIPWCAIAAAILFVAGLYLGLVVAPTDFQQGDSYRVLFVHVPSAWMGMFLYGLVAFYAALGWALRARVSSLMAASLSVTGAMFTALALITGSFWGRPTWGTWWVWDARTTSTLILLFLYIGFISLRAAIDDQRRADRAAAVLALVGVVNVPIIYFSVEWWSTLHQGATLRLTGETTMDASMLTPLLVMIAASWLYSVAVVLLRFRTLIREREPFEIASAVRG